MWILILVIALFFIAASGVVLPILPGVPIAWLGFFIFAYSADFRPISLFTVLIFLGFTLLTILMDFLLPIWGLKIFKPSRAGIVGTVLGFVIGIVAGGPFGVIIGPLIGALVGELLSGKDLLEALKISAGTLVGFILSTVLKLALIAIMAGYIITSLF